MSHYVAPIYRLILPGFVVALLLVLPARAEVLWSDPASRVIHATPVGSDILGGKVKRDDKASDVLYFKFHVDPLSDAANEPYYALFQLSEGGTNRLAVGNALEAWGYSAAYTSELGPENKAADDGGEFNLKSAYPEAAGLGAFKPYELPDHNHDRIIVFKVQFIPGADDLVTVWLQPNLTHGATAENQPANLTTKFKANASFDQIRLRQNGGGNGWIFSDMAIATSFEDFVVVRFWQTWWFITLMAVGLLVGVGISVRLVEQRKFQSQLQLAEQQHALERERARIAQDLHDELGSSLTRISLLSGLLRSDKDRPDLVDAHASKLSLSADETVRALEEIVWAVRPGSDTLQSLVDYITHFAGELFDGTGTHCRLDVPDQLPVQSLPPDLRHNIFLIVKEALTNILKHAKTTEVHLRIRAEDHTLAIIITDNGKGFNVADKPTDGQHNGLINMRRRAGTVVGDLEVSSQPGQGTRVQLKINFPG